MALDFAVLSNAGYPERSVPCNVEVHHALLTEASTRDLPLFARLSDYYQDVEFFPQSLPALVEEIRTLRASTALPEAQRFLEDLCALVTDAVRTGDAVHVLAD